MEKREGLLNSVWIRFGLYVLVLLPLILMRAPTPTNEMKYLNIVDEALRDGHFWCMYLDGAVYADKPPLYFWILMLFRRLLGFHCMPLLVAFSLVPALAIIFLFDKWCSGRLSGRWLIASEMALMTTAYFLGGALVLRMDMLMTLFITLAMWLFWRIYSEGCSTGRIVLFALCVFMAIFSKGPVGIIFPLVTTAVFLVSVRKFRLFFKLWGWRTWLILIALCSIWWTGAYLEGGKEYIDNLLFHQTLDRAVNAFHHKMPWYYYGYTLWYAMGPWSLLTMGTAVLALVRKIPSDDLATFMLTVFASFLVVMSCFSSKLAIYLLPGFGFANYAGYMLLQQADDGTRKWPSTLRTVTFCLSGLIFAAAFVAGIFFPDIIS